MRRPIEGGILLLFLAMCISTGCRANVSTSPAPKPPEHESVSETKPEPSPASSPNVDTPTVTDLPTTSTKPQSAAATAWDYVHRPSPDFPFLWKKDEAAGTGLPAPSKGKGGWWIHETSLALPETKNTDVRFVQWRGESIMGDWAVYAQVRKNEAIVYTSPRLGDELAWYRIVSPPGQGGTALVVGTLNHGGQREWRAGTAVLPYVGGFGEVQSLASGLLGGSMVSADQSKVLVWEAQFADIGPEGVLINCLLCPQHMTVTPYSWIGLKLVKGEPYRTRLMYQAWSAGAALEQPVLAQALQSYDEGLALLRAGKLEAARQQFTKALSLDPTFSDAANELGHTFILEENWSAAVSPLQAALKIDELHPYARYNLATALFRLGRYQEALTHAAYAATLQRDRKEPQVLLQEIHAAIAPKH